MSTSEAKRAFIAGNPLGPFLLYLGHRRFLSIVEGTCRNFLVFLHDLPHLQRASRPGCAPLPAPRPRHALPPAPLRGKGAWLHAASTPLRVRAQPPEERGPAMLWLSEWCRASMWLSPPREWAASSRGAAVKPTPSWSPSPGLHGAGGQGQASA